MKKFGGFGRDKVALFLVCMSVLGNKASATNTKKAQNPQIVATEGVVNDKNSNKGLINWVKNHKRQLGVGSTLTVATAVAFTILGVKYLGKKNKDNNNIDEISNNIKGDKTTNVLDVDNKKINLKINLNQENDKPMSNEEAVKNCMDKLIPA